MNQYISVEFKTDPVQSEIIAALLLDLGYEGAEERNEGMIVSIKEENFDEAAVKEIMGSFNIAYTLSTIQQQNWNAQWESSFEPVQVENFALIRASFHDPVPGMLHDIIITPKMSFGTGHHATTYLMIQQMSEMDLAGKTVIDFGTGTGVLAILAEKMGAAHILAIDNDEWSINNSQENIAANHCSHIELQLAEEIVSKEKVSVILANINLNVILANLEKIKALSAKEALVLFSGLLKEDEENISRALKNNGFQILKVTHRNGWICLLTSA